MTKRTKLRYNEYYNMQSAVDELYSQSKRGKIFTDLMSIIRSEDNIKLAYRNIKRNGGSYTPGMDGKTIIHIEKMSEDAYVRMVQNKLKWYKPKAVKRVEIPKPNGGSRPLGIPCISDRLVQQCIKQVLEPICEAKFHENSYGFRPVRSAENAIACAERLMQRSNLHFVVDVDIKGFFDNVNHSKLIKQMWQLGIRDKVLISVIKEMLKAPIFMPNGEMILPTKGTPQGGILSPLLANIVLNELDWWVSSQWKDQPTHRDIPKQYDKKTGMENKANIYWTLRRSRLKEVYIVRYADDFKIFCRKRSDADKMFAAVKLWLSERLKLEISPEKSSVVNLKKHYSDFLGFKLKVVKKRDKYVVRTHMCDKAIARETQKLLGQIKRIECPPDFKRETVEVNLYNAMVIGIHEYFQIANQISGDCNRISRQIIHSMKDRLGKRLTKKGDFHNGFIRQKYGKSKQVRYVGGKAVCPIGYCKSRNPLSKKYKVNIFTCKGRSEIHDSLKINMEVLNLLMRKSDINRSIEYQDNRISLYCAQYGKCAVSGKELWIDEIHCHHKLPVNMGGTDEYKNLVIIHIDVHRLIHATDPATVAKYLKMLNLKPEQLKKLNALRKRASLEEI